MTCVYFHPFESKCVRKIADKCDGCKQCLELIDPMFVEKWVDPLTMIDRSRRPASDALRNLLANRPAFLLCGGPSANDLPLELLNRRGIFTLGVNNAAGHPRVRPQAFVCSDPPMKFSHSIWLDPGIMKFVPTPKLDAKRGTVRRKLPNGLFVNYSKTPECPNVWGFQRWSWLSPDDSFFQTDGACWGNNISYFEKMNQPKRVCTMLLGLRILRFLGARRIYLVGVDFRMAPDYGYSFAQARDPGASGGNNELFQVVNAWLCEMQAKGSFARFGLEVYNCFERSGLRAFPYVPFEEAIADAAGIVEEFPSLAGWYEKDEGKLNETCDRPQAG